MKIKYFAIGVLLLALVFGFSGNAKALTAQDLQAQINALMTQIIQLQEQLKQQQNQENGSWCFTFTKNIAIGEAYAGSIGGSGVLEGDLQALIEALIKEKIFASYYTIPASYDESIASLVSEFQEKYASEILTPSGLKKGTGYVGPATRKKLNALYGCSNVVKPVGCIQDAKQCSDGSYVSRVAPNCEFAQCPEVAQCKNLWWHDNSNKICQQKQFCGAFMYYGLQTFKEKEDCVNSLNSGSQQCNVDSDCLQPTCAIDIFGFTRCPHFVCVDGRCSDSNLSCKSGETKKYTCSDGSLVNWCGCGDNGKWSCVISPEIQCATSCKNLWWHDNSNKICQQKQFCGAFMYYGLKTFSNESDCKASLGFGWQCKTSSDCPTHCYFGGTCENYQCVNGNCVVSTNQDSCGQLIYFSADTCPFSKKTDPVINQYMQDSGCVEVVKHAVSEVTKLSTDSLAIQYKVQGTPTFIFVDKNGCFGEISKIGGNTKLEDIKSGIANFKCP